MKKLFFGVFFLFMFSMQMGSSNLQKEMVFCSDGDISRIDTTAFNINPSKDHYIQVADVCRCNSITNKG